MIADKSINLDTLHKVLFDNEKLELSEECIRKVEESFDFLQSFSSDKIIYGINTGFGPMAQYRIEDQSLIDLQYNIIRSHSTGAGKPLPELYVKAAMIARLYTFLQGKSGVHLELVSLLCEFINRGIYRGTCKNLCFRLLFFAIKNLCSTFVLQSYSNVRESISKAIKLHTPFGVQRIF